MKAHLASVHAQQVQTSLTQEDIDVVAADILALTLMDNGPDLLAQPSWLWTSQATFHQHRGPYIAIPSSCDSPSVNDIVDTIGCLSFSEEAPSSKGDSRNIHCLTAHSLSPPLPSSTSTTAFSVSPPKKERSRHTTKVLSHLTAIATRITLCQDKLQGLPSDKVLCDVEDEVSCYRATMEAITRHTPRIDHRKTELSNKLDQIDARIIELRCLMPASSLEPVCYDSDHHFNSIVDHTNEVAQVTMFLAIICVVIMGVSRPACDLIMGLLSLILNLAWKNKDGSLAPWQAHILAQIPMSVTTVLLRFHLDGCVTIYAPLYKAGSIIPIYPEQCSHKPRPDSEACNEPLLQPSSKNGTDNVPIQPFAYHNFMDYLAGLLSRKNIEKMMDDTCDKTMESLSQPSPTFVKNVFEADFVRSFEGPNTTPEKKVLFIDCPNGEGRFIFSLNIDFFNPEGMRV
ncbi:hypothetical protein K439DRAFT_1610223 [Ramaria rubella]|nr:hypothetical protein K439DRAFT_1610223 [Ramaria rubella]